MEPQKVVFTGELKSASAFHSITWTPVRIDPNPAAKYVYKLSSNRVQGADGQWYEEQVFGLLKPALSTIMQAAGVEVVTHNRTDDRSDPRVAAFYTEVRWQLPDGTYVSAIGEYELDLRLWVTVGDQKIPGARFSLEISKERDKLLVKRLPENEQKTFWKTGKAGLAKLEVIFNKMSDEEKSELMATAEGMAARTIVDMQPHVVSRADTGSLNRALRSLFSLKSGYTRQELEAGFIVPRTFFDRAAMLKSLGSQGEMLQIAEAIKSIGITPEDYARVRAVLQAPAVQLQPPAPIEPEQDHDDEPDPAPAPATQAVIENKPAEKVSAPPPPPMPEDETGPEQPAVTPSPLKYRSAGGVAEVEVGDNVWKPANAEVGKIGAATMKKLEGYFGHPKHVKNYLLKHFNVAKFEALTWEQLAALIASKRDDKHDPRWYPEKAEGSMAQIAVNELGADAVVITPKTVDILKAYGLKEQDFTQYKGFLTHLLALDDPKCLAFMLGSWSLPDNLDEFENLAMLLATKAIAIGDEQWKAIVSSAEELPF